MSTLLLRLAAPLQAWGSSAKFETRGTERTPTKSGVIGMIASALGRKRTDEISDLVALRFGVRVDREGTLLRDYHTAQAKKPYVTNRYYLSDAVFLVGLEGSMEQLVLLDAALHHPAYPLFLGRRSCPPQGRLSLGIRPGSSLLDALREEPLLTETKEGSRFRIVYDLEAEEGTSYVMLRDQPISFSFVHRRHGFRRVSESTVVRSIGGGSGMSDQSADHDPFAEWGE